MTSSRTQSLPASEPPASQKRCRREKCCGNGGCSDRKGSWEAGIERLNIFHCDLFIFTLCVLGIGVGDALAIGTAGTGLSSNQFCCSTIFSGLNRLSWLVGMLRRESEESERPREGVTQPFVDRIQYCLMSLNVQYVQCTYR